MNWRIFETYVETQLAPTLAKVGVVILDKCTAHKIPINCSRQAQGASARQGHQTTDVLWQAVATASPTECRKGESWNDAEINK